ncbi:hypothetical protein RJ55_01091 [Drechmeria coniospora]|nr:hypothetical protein RJ55_01091 [Drechmeria coniospora]
MILGPVSLVDCLVFVLLLAPQLLWHVGLFRTTAAVIPMLPFLVLRLPWSIIRDRYWAGPTTASSSVPGFTVFEHIVIRCVRYAFRNLPASIGRVFFHRNVALPFLRWRMMRHGYLKCPVVWRECIVGQGEAAAKGVWIWHDPKQPPDVAVYFVHGGGFALGSCYFYLEFLLAWHHLLLDAGYGNPAIFALDYTLVPDETYPTQVSQTVEGYKHVLETVKDGSKVCVAGDSAGGTLILSLLLVLGSESTARRRKQVEAGILDDAWEQSPPESSMPRMAVLISPWVKLVSNLHYPSKVDYLDRRTLRRYAVDYAGESMLDQSPASPGSCTDEMSWRAASPQRGYFVVLGDEEVFAPDIQGFVRRQAKSGIEIEHGG